MVQDKTGEAQSRGQAVHKRPEPHALNGAMVLEEHQGGELVIA